MYLAPVKSKTVFLMKGYVMECIKKLILTAMLAGLPVTPGYGMQETTDIFDRTLLIFAVINENIDAVKKLLESGADVNQADKRGDTPLHYAARNGFLKIAEILIAHNADVNAITRITRMIIPPQPTDGKTQHRVELATDLYVAELNKHPETVGISTKIDTKVSQAYDSGGRTPLIFAAINGHVNVVDLLIRKRANVDQASTEGLTPLICAAMNDRYAMVVGRLLKAHAGIDQADIWGMTSLHYAAARGCSDIVRILLRYHADVNKADNWGMTPLHFAALNGHSNIVKMLLDAHANPNLKNNIGKTPLDCARKSKDKETIGLLISHSSKQSEGSSTSDTSTSDTSTSDTPMSDTYTSETSISGASTPDTSMSGASTSGTSTPEETEGSEEEATPLLHITKFKK